MVDRPSGSICEPICAFSTFTTIWNKYLPYLTIRPKSLDTCLQCHIFRNQQKYKDSIQLVGIDTDDHKSNGKNDDNDDESNETNSNSCIQNQSSMDNKMHRLKKLMDHN